MLTHGIASLLLLLLALLLQNPDAAASLDAEGRALLRFKEAVEADPFAALSSWSGGDRCSWFGVECSGDGKVVALNLKDLCLKGILTPELGKLIHLKSLILSNNSFYGTIPREIGDLQKLQVLDLGYNNLSRPLPPDLDRILSLEILVLRRNKLMNNILPELHDLNVVSELRVDHEGLSSTRGPLSRNVDNPLIRRFLQVVNKPKGRHHRRGKNLQTNARSPSPSTTPSVSQSHPTLDLHAPSPEAIPPSNIFPLPPSSYIPGPSPSDSNVFLSPVSKESPRSDVPLPSPSSASLSPVPHQSPRSDVSHGIIISSPSDGTSQQKKHTTYWAIYTTVGIGISFLVALYAVYMFFCRTSEVVTIMPWSTGLSGHLQKAFVTGVPSLRRSELERACEDFSNVVGSLSDCMLYKGTLSSGVEIAVTSTMVTLANDWTAHSEAQFRKKISMLSQVNHKNFMSLLGYSAEEEPFTRMMVFEYAPNGTLFEHLHIREAEHLDWATRLRISMGIAYCLEHLHQLNPPVVLSNLNSSSIYLSDDYAAMVSDLAFWTYEPQPADESPDLWNAPLSGPESIVYKFGIILLELISGRRPFSEDDGLLVLYASSYLTGQRPLLDMVDPTLESFHEEEVRALCEVIRPCINPNARERPTMTEVVERLRLITVMAPDGAIPKLSPLWWAELEIISAETN